MIQVVTTALRRRSEISVSLPPAVQSMHLTLPSAAAGATAEGFLDA